MAKLEGTDFHVGAKAFSLAPVKPVDDGKDAEAYRLVLWTSLVEEPHTYTFSVANWQMGQDDVWVLARTFAEAAALVEAKLPVDIWRTGKQHHAYLCASIDWLDVSMFGNSRQQKLRIVLYVKENFGSDMYRRFFLQTGVIQAVQFGLELEKEIIESSPLWAKENDRIAIK